MYSTGVDTWSVGCIFGELVKGSPMFQVRWRDMGGVRVLGAAGVVIEKLALFFFSRVFSPFFR